MILSQFTTVKRCNISNQNPKLLRPYLRRALIEFFLKKQLTNWKHSGSSDNEFVKISEIFSVMLFFLDPTQHIPPKGCQYIRRYGLMPRFGAPPALLPASRSLPPVPLPIERRVGASRARL